MPRKRIIYQSEALFVGPTGGANLTQINRVQSANYSFDITRQDINQFGQLGAIDRVIVEQPTVSLDFSYYANDGANETGMGFVLGTTRGALADILSGGKDILNYYILVSPEGTDANIDTSIATGQGKTIGIGNAGLTSYSVEASVGGFPTVSVNAEALNMKFYASTTGHVPTVNPLDGAPNSSNTFTVPIPTTGLGFTALRPGDISLAISGVGFNSADLKIQSFSLSTDIGREAIQKLGSKYAFSREISFPVTVTASVEAVVGDIGGTDNLGNALTDIVCNDANSWDLQFTLGQSTADCLSSTPPTKAMRYTLKGAKLDSQEVSSAIGDNKSVTLGFSAQIAGPTDTAKGLFIEGV